MNKLKSLITEKAKRISGNVLQNLEEHGPDALSAIENLSTSSKEDAEPEMFSEEIKNNIKNATILGIIEENKVHYSEGSVEPMTNIEFIKKMVSDPLFIWNDTKKFMDISVFPEMMELSSHEEKSFFSELSNLFFRNYFKILLLFLLFFQMIYYQKHLEDSRLKILLLVFIICLITIVAIFVKKGDQ
jgi:hypothetical protein